jgi:hypothetical protein
MQRDLERQFVDFYRPSPIAKANGNRIIASHLRKKVRLKSHLPHLQRAIYDAHQGAFPIKLSTMRNSVEMTFPYQLILSAMAPLRTNIGLEISLS